MILHKTISDLLPVVEEAGRIALQYFASPASQKTEEKEDRTLVTEADRKVEEFLEREIRKRFPEYNLIGEEKTLWFREEEAPTIAIDPIDGTTAFTVGLPGWSISVGVLDAAARPAGGIIFSPAWNALFFADLDPATPMLFNQKPVRAWHPPTRPEFGGNTNIFLDSKFQRRFFLEAFPGKVRCYGSTALHMALTSLENGPSAAQAFACYVWDLAAAHAIVARTGGVILHQDGSEIDYRPILRGDKTDKHILGGRKEYVDLLMQCIEPRIQGAERESGG